MNFLKHGDKVILSNRVSEWKVLNSTTSQYRVDNLKMNTVYIVGSCTPILKVRGGDQQFVSLENMYTTYPSWCFDKQ